MGYNQTLSLRAFCVMTVFFNDVRASVAARFDLPACLSAATVPKKQNVKLRVCLFFGSHVRGEEPRTGDGRLHSTGGRPQHSNSVVQSQPRRLRFGAHDCPDVCDRAAEERKHAHEHGEATRWGFYWRFWAKG